MIEETDAAQRYGWPCSRCGAVNDLTEEFCTACGGDGRTSKRTLMAQISDPVSRFPSSPETRRAILSDIASANEKYARPFDRGSVARVSFAGTESWAEYGEVVLQMAILDTMLSIEEKLGELLARRQSDSA